MYSGNQEISLIRINVCKHFREALLTYYEVRLKGVRNFRIVKLDITIKQNEKMHRMVWLNVLIANCIDGSKISLADPWSRDELLELRKTNQFSCPCCKGRVILKVGQKKLWHFAHYQEEKCVYEGEPESQYHLKGKLDLFYWLITQGIPVQLEPYIPEIKQRPDLLVHVNNSYYAIEYQCSPISSELFTKRTDSYLNVKIRPLWILGGNRLSRVSKNTYHLSTHDWQYAITSQLSTRPYFNYYCPSLKSFIILRNCLPYSKTHTFANLNTIKQEHISFLNLIRSDRIKSSQEWHDEWLQMKKMTRLYISRYRYKSEAFNLVQNLLYSEGYSFSILPSEVNLPVDGLHWIETPSNIWQAWILAKYVLPSAIGDNIFYPKIYSEFQYFIKKGIFSIRRFSFIKTGHFSVVIRNYLEALVKLGILERTSSSSYKKINNIERLSSIEELMKFDLEILKKLFD